jgi:tetratricopeptide (TPR) repeat protein
MFFLAATIPAMPRGLICAFAVITFASTVLAAPKTWQLANGGQWGQLAGPATRSAAAAAPEPALDRINDLLGRAQSRRAEKLGIAWLLSHRDSPQRDRGLFLVARALYQYGNRVKSFYYLDELLDTYPDSALFYPALEKQFQIADAFLRGYKRRFLGIPMFSAEDEGVEMMWRIQQRSPGSPLAEKALLRTAEYYFDDQQYDVAADTYAEYVRRYPRSPIVTHAMLRQAYASYAQFKGPRFDASPLIDAREELRTVAAQDPKLAQEQNIQELLDRTDRTLAQKLWLTADFYRRTHEPRGAVYTYRYLTKAFPASPEAQKAREALAKMPQWALAETPEPGNIRIFAPTGATTQPGAELPPSLRSR